MPKAPLSPCPAPGCSELSRGPGRCAKHKKSQRRQYEGSQERLADQRFYTASRWRKVRAVKLPYEVLPKHGKDVRDFLTEERKETP